MNGMMLASIDTHIRRGRFQRSLAVIAGMSGLLSALEVTLQHYRGSYGQKIMYSPVALSLVLLGSGAAASINPIPARKALRLAGFMLIADGVIGFGFHIRGIARRPGGWRLPVTNVVMGPPLFAPLLLGIGGYLGVIASYLRPEESEDTLVLEDTPLFGEDQLQDKLDETFGSRVSQGKFQKQMCLAMTASAVLNGFESFNSHYKSGFSHPAQWMPVALTPPLVAAGLAGMVSQSCARTVVPTVSLAAVAVGGIGVFYHARAVARRPGGRRQLFYNLVYGPPLFAPLLFAATGFLGLLASRLQRE